VTDSPGLGKWRAEPLAEGRWIVTDGKDAIIAESVSGSSVFDAEDKASGFVTESVTESFGIFGESVTDSVADDWPRSDEGRSWHDKGGSPSVTYLHKPLGGAKWSAGPSFLVDAEGRVVFFAGPLLTGVEIAAELRRELDNLSDAPETPETARTREALRKALGEVEFDPDEPPPAQRPGHAGLAAEGLTVAAEAIRTRLSREDGARRAEQRDGRPVEGQDGDAP